MALCVVSEDDLAMDAEVVVPDTITNGNCPVDQSVCTNLICFIGGCKLQRNSGQSAERAGECGGGRSIN